MTTLNAALFPYDFAESPVTQDLHAVAAAAFVSISILDESGHLTSYGASAELPAVQDLIAAVLAAEPIDPPAESTITVAEGIEGPTLTFVLPDRQTLTFTLNLGGGTISRGNRTWRPPADLRELIQAASVRP